MDRLESLDAPAPLVATFDEKPVVDYLENGRIRRARYRVNIGLQPGYGGASEVETRTINAKTARGRVTSTTVTWSSPAPVVIIPSRVHFSPPASAADKPTYQIAIHSRDGQDFRILSIDGGPNIEARVKGTNPDGERLARIHVVELVLQPRESTGRFAAGRVTINTDHPEVPNVSVEWTAIMPLQ